MPRQRTRPLVPVATFTEHDLTDAADMMTLDAAHPIWTGTTLPFVGDSFVRLYPPIGKTAEQVAAVKQWLLGEGSAKAVKVMPIPVEAVPDAPDAPTTSSQPVSIRQVVMQRAARTQGVRDHGMLAELLTICMDQAGI